MDYGTRSAIGVLRSIGLSVSLPHSRSQSWGDEQSESDVSRCASLLSRAKVNDLFFDDKRSWSLSSSLSGDRKWYLIFRRRGTDGLRNSSSLRKRKRSSGAPLFKSDLGVGDGVTEDG